MSKFTVPQPLIDLAGLPPLLRTSEPGSFAHNTLRVRVPAILQETISLNAFPPEIRRDLEELHAELVCGVIRPLREDATDRAFWEEVSAACYGHSWLDAPWYWAEAYFYRRVLEATRYFQPGPWQGLDPYAAKKQAEWAPDAAPRLVNTLLESLPTERPARCERLFHASLWGNRADLSYAVAAHLDGASDPHQHRSNLLADDTPAVWRFLSSRPRLRVTLLADNAGTELLTDLALADFLLAESLAGEVHLHLKPQPFFVSDAMPGDLLAGLAALAHGGPAAQALGGRLRGCLASGRLRLVTHWHAVTSLFYSQMPHDLRRDLAAADLVIVKGDANYRRLVGDAHWPPATRFEHAVGYFPAALVALLTLKSELIVGLQPGDTERLAAEDPAWLVNGQRGVIQARL